jgi:hypothetical protein
MTVSFLPGRWEELPRREKGYAFQGLHCQFKDMHPKMRYVGLYGSVSRREKKKKRLLSPYYFFRDTTWYNCCRLYA